MAAVIYPKYKEALLTGSSNISLTTGDVKAILIDTADYTYDAAHDFLDDVAAAARVATSAAVGTKTVTNGVFNCGSFSWSTVSGDQCEAIIWYIDTGVEGTSRLVAYDDGSSGLPITPNGQDITFTPDTGANKVFAL